MKRSTFLILALFLFSCKSSHHKFDPEARKLNDLAVNLRDMVFSKNITPEHIKINTSVKNPADIQYNVKPHEINDDSLYEKKIDLLNQALKIDSNYFTAYWNKFEYQNRLKQYAGALSTGKQLVRLSPNDVRVKFEIGKAYDRVRDTVHSWVYYEEYLFSCNSVLDTMSVNNKDRRSMEFSKAMALILLGQEKKGRDILKRLYDTETKIEEKPMDSLYMTATRKDLIYGKEIRIGNSFYSISP